MYRAKMVADDISSPERMDFSEESSFEASPLNKINYHHTRSSQQFPPRGRSYGKRRTSCPPPLSPFALPNSMCNTQPKVSKRKSTGDFLDMIDKGFTGMQLESPPGDLRRHQTVEAEQEIMSNASTESSKSFFSFPSFGFGGSTSSSSSQMDKNLDYDSEDSDTTIVSGGFSKQDGNNNGKVPGIKRQSGFAAKVSCKSADLSAIMDRSDSAEMTNDDIEDDDDRMSTVSKSSSRTTQPQRLLVTQNAKLSNRKSRCLCYLHSLVLCSTVVIMTYFGSQEMHKQWCSSRLIVNVTQLEEQLSSRVFGQHVATDLIVKVFQDFIDHDGASVPPTTLSNSVVFSFHGWTGIGKNYISSIIEDLMPDSSVIKLIIPLHFPYTGSEYSEQYQENIEHWILSNISDCTLNLFIIDEMDKAGRQIVQGLQNAIESVKSDKWKHTKVVILLLSNTGGTVINKVLFDHLSQGLQRETLSYDSLREAVLSDPIATWHKELYQQKLIDYIVPFLPLQHQHVEMCIRRYLEQRNLALPNSIIAKIMADFEYFPPGNPVFSKSGCKRVESKTVLYL